MKTPRLGNYVRTKTHNHQGRIYAIHHIFPEEQAGSGWFESQKPPIPVEAKLDYWVSVLTRNGGSVLIPKRDIASVSTKADYKLNNPYEEMYFDDAEFKFDSEKKALKFIEWVRNDYQLNPKHPQFEGFLNVDVDHLQDSELRIGFRTFVDRYEAFIPLLKKYNLAVEDYPSTGETIFMNT